MKPVEVIELYVPYGQEFGWIRTRGRWGRITTLIVDAKILAGMADDMMADPDQQIAIDASSGRKSREYAKTWPPAYPPHTWLVQEDHGGGTTKWVRRD